MALIDNQFISKIVKDPMSDWLLCGVTPKMVSLDVRPVYIFIRNRTIREGGTVPTRETIKQFYQNFRFKSCPESVEFYANLIIKRNAESKIQEMMNELASDFQQQDDEFDLDQAIEKIRKTASIPTRIQKITDVFYGRDPESRIKAFESYATGAAADCSLGFQVLDEDLIGAEKGNFFIIGGTPGAGKTWLLLKAMYNLWKIERKSVLLFSFELSEALIKRRLDSIIAKTDYNKFRRGLLTPKEKKIFVKRINRHQQLANEVPFQIITTQNVDPMSTQSPARLDYIYSKIQQHKPDIVAIDGFYLMQGQGESEWEKIASLTRGFHSITQSTGVIGWGTTQLTKTSDEKKPKLRDLSFSWTFAQDTDGAFLLSRPEDMRLAHEAALTAAKFREAEDNLSYTVRFNPGADIEIVRADVQVENPLMEA